MLCNFGSDVCVCVCQICSIEFESSILNIIFIGAVLYLFLVDFGIEVVFGGHSL